MYKKLILFLLFFCSFEGLGLRADWWGGFGKDSLGFFGVLQLLLLFFMIFYPIINKKGPYFLSNNSVSTPIKMILLLTLIILFQGFFQVYFNNRFNLGMLFSNFMKIKYIFYIFIFSILFLENKSILKGVSTIVHIALLSSIFAIIIIAFNITDLALKISITEYVGREFRVIMPTGLLIAFGYFYMLVKYILSKKNIYLFIIFVFFSALLFQMHRTIIISIILVTIYAFLLVSKLNFKSAFFLFFFIFFILLIIFFIFDYINYSANNILESFIETKSEINDSTGSYNVRTNMISSSIFYTLNNYLILGVGLDWEVMNSASETIYLEKGFIAAPTFDTGYGSIIITYGILGVAIYSFLIYRLFKSISFSLKNAVNIENKTIAYTLLLTLVYLLLTGFSSDNFIQYNSSVIFFLIISLTYSLENAIKKTL